MLLFHKSDDLDLEFSRFTPQFHCFPTTSLPRLNFACELFIDDRYPGSAEGVAACKLSTRNQRNSQRCEMVRPYQVVTRALIDVRPPLETFDRNVAVPVTAVEYHNR